MEQQISGMQVISGYAFYPSGTGSNHYESKIQLWAKLIEEKTFGSQLRSDYYTGGSITLSNIKLTRATTQSMQRDCNSELGTLPVISEQGYTFDGWYTAATGGTKISSYTRMPAADTTYYAHWN